LAVHISFNKVCDRCGKPYDMQSIKYESGLPPLDPKPLVLTRAGLQVFSLEDLCPSCESVVDGLVDRLMLADDKKKSKKDDSSKKDDTSKEEKKEGAGVQAGTDDDRPY